LPDDSLKPNFGPTFLRPFFLSSFFCRVAIFWLGGLWGPDFDFEARFQIEQQRCNNQLLFECHDGGSHELVLIFVTEVRECFLQWQREIR
jgi:hypothetical protein